MDLDLADMIKDATTGVFSTMLGTDLVSHEPFEDPTPFFRSEVTGFIGLAGDVAGYISVHCSRRQATDFTARLIGGELDDITSDDDVRDAVGEITNMVAGNMKTALSRKGTVEIALPTVTITPSSEMRVNGSVGLVVPFEDYTGQFWIELVLANGRPLEGP